MKLTDADAETLWSALVDVRDQYPRAADDADTWDLVSAIESTVEAIVARAVNEALTEAADNMPLARPGQPYEHAAGWLRRRADALTRTT